MRNKCRSCLFLSGTPDAAMSCMRIKRLLIFLVLPVTVVSGLAGAWVISEPRPAFSEKNAPALDAPGNPERGRLILSVGNCASCHASPGQRDRFRLGGGMALATPFGTLRVPNISPDPIHGIGKWRTIDLANALMSGVSPEGSHYYPGLPYPTYAHMRVEDVRDLMAFIRTLPAVPGRAPPHELSFPFNVRRIIGFWKFLFFDPGPLTPDPSRGASWNRGYYLVEALAHCAECHSSRNVLGAIKPQTRFAGGRDAEDTGFVPNITPRHIGSWSQSDIVEVLTTGRTPVLRDVGSTMVDVVNNTSMLPQADREAIASYVKSLPARPTPQP
jgi:mono/diheme cytochrome c family protein